MDPTADDVRNGNAAYDPISGTYVWLAGKGPVWDSGVGADVVTVNASPKKVDSSVMALLLLFGAWAWITLDEK